MNQAGEHRHQPDSFKNAKSFNHSILFNNIVCEMHKENVRTNKCLKYVFGLKNIQ